MSIQLNFHMLSLYRLIFQFFLFLDSVVASALHHHSCCRYVMDVLIDIKHMYTQALVLSLQLEDTRTRFIPSLVLGMFFVLSQSLCTQIHLFSGFSDLNIFLCLNNYCILLCQSLKHPVLPPDLQDSSQCVGKSSDLSNLLFRASSRTGK